MTAARLIWQFSILVFGLAVSTIQASSFETAKPFDHAGLARQVLEKHVVPGYEKLASAAKSLSQAIDRHCTQPSRTLPKSVGKAFDDFVVAWGHVEHINFGPITKENRLERILFFPDRRGLGARQVSRALQTRDPDVTDVQKLASKSVALQGLSALEIVLFQDRGGKPEAPEAQDHRCRFALAISGNLQARSQEILNEWKQDDGFRRLILNPGPDNPQFFKPSEVTQVLAKSLDQGLERIREERIAGPLGFGKQKRRLPAVLERSGRTFRLTTANIEGLRDLYTTGGMQQAIIGTGRAKGVANLQSNAKLVLSEITTAHTISKRLVGVSKPFDNPDILSRLLSVGFPLKNARTQLAILMAATAGLTLGFNSSDGD